MQFRMSQRKFSFRCKLALYVTTVALSSFAPSALLAQTAPGESVDTEKFIDLSTPQLAARYFLDLYGDQRYEEAAQLLDLSPRRRSREGAPLARRLGFVLSQRDLFDLDENAANGSNGETPPPARALVGRLPLGQGEAALVMAAHRERGRTVWRFAPETVRLIPALYREYGPGPFAALLPAEYAHRTFLGLELWQWAGLPAALVFTLIFSFIVVGLGEKIVHHFVRRTRSQWDDDLFKIIRTPMRTLSSMIVLFVLVRWLRLPGGYGETLNTVLKIALVGAGVWLLLRPANFLFNSLQEKLTAGSADEARIRGVRTQIVVVRRVVYFLVVLIGLALALTQFKEVRALGVSLLASAGIAGVMLSFAAQKSLSSLLAGIQLALTQPLRIGDKVLINGEVGWIEEINLTYLVMRIWDLRRMVVPIVQVLDQPFENWSLHGKQQLGDVTFQTDYGAPVDLLREEAARLVQANPNWDGEVCNLQVTGSTDRTLTLRALMSAHPDKIWDLRCQVREQLIAYLQNLDDGKYLPRLRLDGDGKGE